MLKKILFLLVLFIFISEKNYTFADIAHYKNLKRLEFDLYRNNNFIGKHIYQFTKEGDALTVKSTINFEIKKLGVSLYKYSAEGEEKYIDNKFNSFASNTNQNNKIKFANIFKEKDQFFIKGTSYTGKAPDDFIIGTWWNHEIVKHKAQISAVSGRIIKQNVNFLGKENLTINDKAFSALKFNFVSSDKSLSKNKRLNTTVWYDEKTLIWIKASFKKKGKWEYRLKNIN